MSKENKEVKLNTKDIQEVKHILDDRGIPTELDEKGIAAPYCPPKSCDLCTGYSAVRKKDSKEFLTSWELCQEMNTCTATVDWELLYNGR